MIISDQSQDIMQFATSEVNHSFHNVAVFLDFLPDEHVYLGEPLPI